MTRRPLTGAEIAAVLIVAGMVGTARSLGDAIGVAIGFAIMETSIRGMVWSIRNPRP